MKTIGEEDSTHLQPDASSRATLPPVNVSRRSVISRDRSRISMWSRGISIGSVSTQATGDRSQGSLKPTNGRSHHSVWDDVIF